MRTGLSPKSHGRTDAHEDVLHGGDVLEMAEEDGDEEDEEDGHEDVGSDGDGGAPEAAQALADDGGDVGRQDARHGLREGYGVEHVGVAHPMVTVHHLALDEGYHGIAATDGESADFEKSYEEVAIFYHFYRFRVADGRQAVCVPQK